MEKINFKDIRVGDHIEAHRTYSGGDSLVLRFTVLKKTEYVMDSDAFTFGRSADAEYFLVERPKHTFKVGDTITGEQVADLPNGAVFDLNEWGTDLRYKIDGEVLSARGTVLLYPSGRIVSTGDVDPTPQVAEANLMGLDLRVVSRQIGPWRKAAS